MKPVLSFLNVPPEGEPTGSETVRRIARELDRLEPDVARFVAAFAFLLSRVAAADHEVSEEEARTIEQLVRQIARLPEEQAVLIAELAKSQQRLFGGTDNFLVARELRDVASREQRLSVIRCLFAVAAADHRIRIEEGNEIARIAQELRVEHGDLALIRSEYRDYLAVRQEEKS